MRMARYQSKLAAALGVVLAALTGVRGARAHGEVETDRREHTSDAAHAPDVTPREGASEEEHPETLEIAADLVVGFGKVPLAVQQAPQSFTPVPPYTPGSARSTSESVILEGGYHLVPAFAVGVAVPFSFASFSPTTEDSRGTSSFGNVEVSGEYEAEL